MLAALTDEGWSAETGQIDSSHIKAHRSAGGAKGGARANECHWRLARGQDDQDPRPRRSARTPLRIVLTPSYTSDMKGADLLIGEAAPMKRLIADRGYDANRIRAALRDQGTDRKSVV